MCEYKVPAEIVSHGYPALIQPFLETMRTDRIKMMETVKILNDSLQEFRKVTDEGEFLSVAKKGALSTIFYDKIEANTKNEKREKRRSSRKHLTDEEKRIKKLKANNWYYLDDSEESVVSLFLQILVY